MLWSNHLAIFAQVARCGSFTAAAERLGMPKSTVSQRIAELEAALGAPLLNRTTRRVTLTKAGRALVARGDEVLEQERLAFETMRLFRSSAAGRLIVTAPNILGSIVLAPFVAEFLDRHPRVDVELLLTDHLVGNDSFDVGFRIASENTQEPEALRRSVGEIPFRLVATPVCLRRLGAPVAPRDLQRLPCLPHRGEQIWALRSAERVEKVQAQGRLRTDNLIALKEACLAGFGVAALPFYLCNRELDRGDLVRVLPDWALEPLALMLYTPATSRPSQALSLFINEALDRIDTFLRTSRPDAEQCGFNPGDASAGV